MKPRAYGETDLNYNEYLKIPELLSTQVLQSKPPHHDELLFIIIHQAYELWFKLILHELETVIGFLDKAEPLQAHHFMKRVVKIMGLLIDQIHILETMTPADFLKFRNRLMPASGFQSCQFREIEFIAGAKDPGYLRFFENDPEIKSALEKRLREPDIFTAYLNMLVTLKLTTKEDIKTKEGQVKAIAPLYQNSGEQLPLYLLTEALVEFDENLALWREHHVRVVERIIGSKTGTGGSSGVEYLKTTTSKKCFPVLWDVRNYLT